MDFPLYHENRLPPDVDFYCLMCGKSLKDCDTQVTLTSGADLNLRPGQVGRAGERIEAFLSLSFHRSIRPNHDVYARVDVAEKVRGGRFDLAFCSMECLTSFFAELRHELERRVIETEEAQAAV
jgi:hypothetical protein